MIKVENVDVYGLEHAVIAMRNPMNSWDKSDSMGCSEKLCNDCRFENGEECCDLSGLTDCVVGENDLALMQRLFKAGVEHRTYARMIYVWMDITAPLYWWKEMDRYGVGKSQVSTSTMHKIHAKEFTSDDFSHEHMSEGALEALSAVIDSLNVSRMFYNALDGLEAKQYWWDMIQLLPSSYNQKRTVCMSYEVVFKIIKERTGHKLNEWNQFVEILKSLPYVKEIMGEKE